MPPGIEGLDDRVNNHNVPTQGCEILATSITLFPSFFSIYHHPSFYMTIAILQFPC